MEYTCADSWARDRERDASSHHFFINPVFSNLVNLWEMGEGVEPQHDNGDIYPYIFPEDTADK
jgi:hypothetical protein